MRDGPRGFPRDFSCPAVLRNLPNEPACFDLRGCHPLWPAVPDRSTNLLVCDSPALRPGRPYNPTVQARWFRLFRVRSPLLAGSIVCFLFLARWFTSPRASTGLCIQPIPRYYPGGFPFGNRRVKACLRLTDAYRSLPRPSSPLGTKAFTVRP